MIFKRYEAALDLYDKCNGLDYNYTEWYLKVIALMELKRYNEVIYSFYEL
jgi:hypothetical protein